MTPKIRACKDQPTDIKLLNKAGHRIIYKIVACDETYIPFYDLAARQENRVWLHRDHPTPNIVKKECRMKKDTGGRVIPLLNLNKSVHDPPASIRPGSVAFLFTVRWRFARLIKPGLIFATHNRTSTNTDATKHVKHDVQSRKSCRCESEQAAREMTPARNRSGRQRETAGGSGR
ncbi:hypothetical protein EVAR_60041_1 [Eumeta japonica]|uniref:Uncharacterized protein n=1 Tax=Eumeta variegata TaxID=151549 RepID=A0A4C1YY51_EUMVA|nr:hypothetical protein EVAR_60041_1 [Eumeta japonica]